MERQNALKLLKEHISQKNLIKHMLATEACMRVLAEKFAEDPADWALAGLLHDLDYDKTKEDFPNHGKISAQILEELSVKPEIIEAIAAHAGHSPRQSRMARALYAVDPLTGLIVAAALMHPQKKLKAVDTGFVLKRFKEKHFARGANREQIKSCSELDLSLEEFTGICLAAMQGIDAELGL